MTGALAETRRDHVRLADNSGSPRPLKRDRYQQVTLWMTPSGKVIGVDEGGFWRGGEALSYRGKKRNGGEGGIRTHGGLSTTPVFETVRVPPLSPH